MFYEIYRSLEKLFFNEDLNILVGVYRILFVFHQIHIDLYNRTTTHTFSMIPSETIQGFLYPSFLLVPYYFHLSKEGKKPFSFPRNFYYVKLKLFYSETLYN